MARKHASSSVDVVAATSHFSAVYGSLHTGLEAGERVACPDEDSLPETRIFSEESIRRAVRELATGKAPGESRVASELVKFGGEYVDVALLGLFQACFAQGVVPEAWKKAMLVPIPKRDLAQSDPANFRPISLTEIPRKAFERVLQRHLEGSMRPLSISQGGFRRNRGCYDMVASLVEIKRQSRIAKRPLFVSYLDIKAAYDTVDRSILWRRCLDYGLQPADVRILAALFDDNTSSVTMGGRKGSPFALNRGLLQGSVLSPLLYSIFLDPLLNHLNAIARVRPSEVPAAVLAYADDLALVSDDRQHMQALLDQCTEFAARNNFSFNGKKCEVQIPRHDDLNTFRVDGQLLKRCDTFKYLGIPIGERGIDIQALAEANAKNAMSAACEFRGLGLNAGGFDIKTASRIIKMFLRSKMEYGLAIANTSKTVVERHFTKALAAVIRIASSSEKRPLNQEALRWVYDIESMEVRHAVLQWRWLRDAASKPGSFLVHHANLMARHSEAFPKASCLTQSAQYEEALIDLDAMFNLRCDVMGIPSSSQGRWLEHRMIRKAVSKDWRNAKKEISAAAVTARYPALGAGFRKLSIFIHPLFPLFAVKKLLFLALGMWPPSPKTCLACGHPQAMMAHFDRHAQSEEKAAQLFSDLNAASEICLSNDIKYDQSSQETVIEKVDSLLRLMSAWGAMWRND